MLRLHANGRSFAKRGHRRRTLLRPRSEIKERAGAARPDKGGEAAPPFALEQHLFYWITHALDRRDSHLAVALKPYRLRVPEWRALPSLHSRHRMSMSELCETTSSERT